MKRLSFLLIPFLLTACAYTLDKEIQDLTIETPNAQGSVCYVYVNKIRYKFLPPQTRMVSKSEQPMDIDCIAPGNRRKKVTIDPALNGNIAGNLMLGPGAPAGLGIDAISNAAFKYPDVIRIDFSGIPVQSMPLPAQNNPDIKQPEEYKLEEFNSALPRLNSDIDTAPSQLQKRVRNTAPVKTTSYIGEANDADKAGVVERYSNPAAYGPSQPAADKAPAPLYPGQ